MFDDVSRSVYHLRFREEAAARAGCEVERCGGDRRLICWLPVSFIETKRSGHKPRSLRRLPLGVVLTKTVSGSVRAEKGPSPHRPMLCECSVTWTLLSGGQSQVLSGQWCPLRLLMKRKPVVYSASRGDN